MIGWPDGFCEALAEAVFHPVRYDQRDAGLSTHFTGKKRAYELTDMIDDMMAVLDAMGWESANLAGLSMGGGLAQFAALLHPTGQDADPLGDPAVRPADRFSATSAFPARSVWSSATTATAPGQAADADGRHPADRGQEPAAGREWVRETAAESVRRHAPDRHARTRQFAAGHAAKMPDGGIARITQPVLAINGDEDPFIRPAAGQKIAETVQNGRFVLVHRMGHLFAEPLWQQLVSEIDRHAV